MTLKVEENRTFKRTVTVSVPVDGGFEDQTVDATYKVLPTQEIAKTDMDTEKGLRNFLTKVVVKLDDLAGPKGEPMPYNDELLQKLISLPYVRGALFQTYLKDVGGAREGN